MAARFSLEGAMIPRSVKRMFDQRAEARDAAEQESVVTVRGRPFPARLLNLSPSGTMVISDALPHIGETVTVEIPDHGAVQGEVRWVRDGRIGLYFEQPLG